MTYDAVIVLNHDCKSGRPNKEGRARIDQAVEIFKKTNSKYLMTTGGFRKTEKISCAAAMKIYALELGVPVDKILIEEKSRHTIHNARFTKEIADKKMLKSFCVVTTAYHLPRSKFIFDRVFKGHDMSYVASKPTLPMLEQASEILQEGKSFLLMFFQMAFNNRLEY